MKPFRDERRAVIVAAMATLFLCSCASNVPASGREPTAKERSNAQKQEELDQMLDRGQRN
ncbi:MAG: hypothetical protein ABI585_00530 [Betaproteobacteria bacterium]